MLSWEWWGNTSTPPELGLFTTPTLCITNSTFILLVGYLHRVMPPLHHRSQYSYFSPSTLAAHIPPPPSGDNLRSLWTRCAFRDLLMTFKSSLSRGCVSDVSSCWKSRRPHSSGP